MLEATPKGEEPGERCMVSRALATRGAPRVALMKRNCTGNPIATPAQQADLSLDIET
jgi:hypothetical protein